MEIWEAKQYMADAKALEAEIVCITGGEPMLHPDLVEKIISECNRLSFPEIWIFTNCYWATDLSKAHKIVRKLGKLGLTKLFTSLDFFHQMYIPVESVKNVIEVSLETGLDVCVDARFVGDPFEENRFNLATRSYLESLRNLLPQVEVVKAQPMFVGRAAESLVKYVKKKPLSEVLNEKCQGGWAGGTLTSPLGVDVDEFGLVSICPRLKIGDTRQKSLREILENYDYRDHTVIATLHDSGMKGLYKLASESGFVPRRSYVNGCHLCYETRKFLNQT